MALVALLFSASVDASSIATVQSLIEKAEYKTALRETNRLIASGREEPQIVFLKGVILQQTGDSSAAVSIYQELIDKHPDYPEPYNNLALHYAQRGDFDQAIVILEKSIESHPSIAIAYQNLTAIYNRMASEAYRKALNSKKPPVPLELTALDRIVVDVEGVQIAAVEQEAQQQQSSQSGNQPAAEPVAASAQAEIEQTESEAPATEGDETIVAAAEQSTAVSQDTAVSDAVESESNETSDDSESATVSNEPAVQQVAALEEPEIAITESKPDTDVREAVINRVFSWAAAWSDQDVPRYLLHYSEDFVPRKLSLDEWKKQRYGRLRWREFIIVKPSKLNVTVDGDDATVSFNQYYKSDRLENTVRKTLKMKKQDENWYIVRELI